MPYGKTIAICCSACGRKVGTYFADEVSDYVMLTDGRERHASAKEVPATRKRGEDFGPRTGVAAYTQHMDAWEPQTTYRWRCGCGADIQLRDDRLKRLQVDERTDPPRVYA